MNLIDFIKVFNCLPESKGLFFKVYNPTDERRSVKLLSKETQESVLVNCYLDQIEMTDPDMLFEGTKDNIFWLAGGKAYTNNLASESNIEQFNMPMAFTFEENKRFHIILSRYAKNTDLNAKLITMFPEEFSVALYKGTRNFLVDILPNTQLFIAFNAFGNYTEAEIFGDPRVIEP